MSSVAPVPESTLKDIKRRKKSVEEDQLKSSRRAARIDRLKEVAYKRAEEYQNEYENAEKKIAIEKETANAEGKIYVEAEPKFAFVIRIRGILHVPPRPRKILQLLRLCRIHSGVFVRLTLPVKNMLKLVEPYVTYGYLDVHTVRALIYKRGYAHISHQRIPIDSNEIIGKQLGKYGIVCLEDLVHEIYTVGPHFREVSRFFWPFKLRGPKGGFRKKSRHFVEGGDAGNREYSMKELVLRMN